MFEKIVQWTRPFTNVVKNKDIERGYAHYPSIFDKMSLVDWNDEHHMGLLNDGVSLIRFLELRDVPAETMDDEAIIELYQKLQKMLSHIVPLEDINPWVVSIYCQDDLTLKGLKKRLLDYIDPSLHTKKITQKFVSVMEDHFNLLSKEDGIFKDPMSDLPFRGRSRRLRLALYRRHTKPLSGFNLSTQPFQELEEVTLNLINALKEQGLSVRVLQGKHVYEWFMRWFNPAPSLTNGDVDLLIEKFPYPKDHEKPFGWSIVQNAFKSSPQTNDKGWLFDELEHRILVFAELEEPPKVGVISRERDIGGKRYALMDKLPAGSIYTIQMVFESKNVLEKHLQKIEKSVMGMGGEPKRVKKDIETAFDEISKDNLLIRTSQAIFIRGKDSKELEIQERALRSMLANASLRVIDTKYNLYPLDIYIRFLPGNYDPYFEKKYLFVSQYLYASDVASLIPFYGRGRGDQLHPMFTFFNRGGEGFIFDPYSTKFKANNSHTVLFGTSGAGKSVQLNYMILQMIAIKNFRVAVLEAGGSFDLTTEYLRAHDVSVYYLKFDRGSPIPINPYIDAYKILKTEDKLDAETIEKHVEAQLKNFELGEATDIEKQANEDRDILNEMVLITRCMITGGDKKEEESMTRADMGLITKVVLETVRYCYKQKKEQVIAEDIYEGFLRLAESDPHNSKRLKDLGLGMTQFLHTELAKFFNCPSAPIPDFDYLHIDLGFLKENGMESGLNVMAISLLSRVLGIAEANQYNARPFVFIKDEAHLLYKFHILAAFSVLMAKVSRKIGLWLMPATQNISDLDGEETKKLLSMMETWICLTLSENEIKHIEKFRALSSPEKRLLSSVRKVPAAYSEAVLLGVNYQGLFRNIPPRICLVLSMTEQSEKAERRRVMRERQCTELEAVEWIAEQLKTRRIEVKEHAVFED